MQYNIFLTQLFLLFFKEIAQKEKEKEIMALKNDVLETVTLDRNRKIRKMVILDRNRKLNQFCDF